MGLNCLLKSHRLTMKVVCLEDENWWCMYCNHCRASPLQHMCSRNNNAGGCQKQNGVYHQPYVCPLLTDSGSVCVL